MKKITLALLIILLAFLIGCADTNNNNVSQPQQQTPGQTTNTDTTAQKIALYSRIIGTYKQDVDPRFNNNPNIFKFQMDSITFNGVKYPFNPLTDLQITERPPELSYLPEQFTLRFNNTDYPVQFSTPVYEPEEKINIIVKDDYQGYSRVTDGSGSDIPSGDLDFSLTGDWNYTITNMGSTTPTKLTINDDNSFTFNKNNAITNGTYTLTGNKITFDYQTTQGSTQVKISDTFTVSGDESEITLTLVKSINESNGQSTESTSMSYMLLGFYTLPNAISINLTK